MPTSSTQRSIPNKRYQQEPELSFKAHTHIHIHMNIYISSLPPISTTKPTHTHNAKNTGLNIFVRPFIHHPCSNARVAALPMPTKQFGRRATKVTRYMESEKGWSKHTCSWDKAVDERRSIDLVRCDPLPHLFFFRKTEICSREYPKTPI